MVLFEFLLIFTASELLTTLTKDDDPYKILGVGHEANMTEIKAAYRKLTIQYHPDISKKDTTAQWVHINDAFELLNDPDRKARFDRFGTTTIQEQTTQQDDNPFKFDERFFTKEHQFEHVFNTPSLTSINFEEIVHDDEEWLFLIYTTVLCPDCDMYIEIFEEFAKSYKKHIKCGRIDITSGTGLALSLGAIGTPSIMYYKRSAEGVTSVSCENEIHSVGEIAFFVSQQWPSKILYAENVDDLNTLLEFSAKNKVLAIQFIRHSSPTLGFFKVANLLKDQIVFGAVFDEHMAFARRFNITSFPSVLLSRNPQVPPRIIETKLRRSFMQWGTPLMAEMDQYTYPQYCSESCFIRIGKADPNVTISLDSVPRTTSWVPLKSKLAKTLNLTEGDWIYVNNTVSSYIVIPKNDQEDVALNEVLENLENLTEIQLDNPLPIDWKFSSTIHSSRNWLYNFFLENQMYFDIAFLVVTYPLFEWAKGKYEKWDLERSRKKAAEEKQKKKEQKEKDREELEEELKKIQLEQRQKKKKTLNHSGGSGGAHSKSPKGSSQSASPKGTTK